MLRRNRALYDLAWHAIAPISDRISASIQMAGAVA